MKTAIGFRSHAKPYSGLNKRGTGDKSITVTAHQTLEERDAQEIAYDMDRFKGEGETCFMGTHDLAA